MYLLDSNIFIEAKNRHYGFDFCPAFWDWLVEQRSAGVVASVDQVSGELKKGNDELATWVKARPEFFLPADEKVPQSLSGLSDWCFASDYTDAAKNEFLQAADYHLVAYAHSHEYTVVTHETSGESKKRIKIPDACSPHGVHCINPYAMLRNEGARFVLG